LARRALARIDRHMESPQIESSQIPDSPAGLSGPAIGLLVGLNMAVIHTGKGVGYGCIFREWKQQLSSAGAALNISASNQCA
jgi:hypothetical protein